MRRRIAAAARGSSTRRSRMGAPIRNPAMTTLLLKNARLFDGYKDRGGGMNVLAADGVIREVSSKPIKAPKGARTLDAKGRTLMPGLIDAHMHAYASDVNMFKVEDLGPAY